MEQKVCSCTIETKRYCAGEMFINVAEAHFRIGASDQETLRRIKIFGCISENVSNNATIQRTISIKKYENAKVNSLLGVHLTEVIIRVCTCIANTL